MDNITMKVVKEIGVLSKNDRGYTKEVNLVSWNGNDPKVDIREWYPGHERCGKGVTLTIIEGEELAARLLDFYNSSSIKSGEDFMEIPQGAPDDPADIPF